MAGKKNSGEGGIRTLGNPKAAAVFETAPIVHSGTSPCAGIIALAEKIQARLNFNSDPRVNDTIKCAHENTN